MPFVERAGPDPLEKTTMHDKCARRLALYVLCLGDLKIVLDTNCRERDPAFDPGRPRVLPDRTGLVALNEGLQAAFLAGAGCALRAAVIGGLLLRSRPLTAPAAELGLAVAL